MVKRVDSEHGGINVLINNAGINLGPCLFKKEAREVVAKLKKDAAVQEEMLAEKQGEANNVLQMITDTMRNANTQYD